MSLSERSAPQLSGTRIPAAGRAGIAVLVGIAIGAATSFGQAWLPDSWVAVTNSASPWLLGAFVAGALQVRRGWAVPAGLVCCLLEVLAYYVITPLRGYPVDRTEIVFWACCAIVGGPLFGWAGWAWLRAGDRLRPVGAAFLPATFLAEAIGSYQLRLHYESDVLLYTVIGLVLLAVVAARTRRPTRTVLTTAALTAVGIAAYWLVLDSVGTLVFLG